MATGPVAIRQNSPNPKVKDLVSKAVIGKTRMNSKYTIVTTQAQDIPWSQVDNLLLDILGL
jgi:hypothetical protein